MPLILVFGASIVQGYADTKGGWVQRLSTYLSEEEFNKGGKYYEVQNLGVAKGETTEDLLKRIDTDVKARLWKEGATTLISIGINDSAIWQGKGGNWVPVKKYRENLQKITEKSKSFSNQVVLIGITFIDDKKTNPIPWDTRFSYLNAEIEKYNDVIKKVANEKNVDFIDLLPKLKKIGWTSLLRDGVHPNNEGHEKLFEIIKEELEESNII